MAEAFKKKCLDEGIPQAQIIKKARTAIKPSTLFRQIEPPLRACCVSTV